MAVHKQPETEANEHSTNAATTNRQLTTNHVWNSGEGHLRKIDTAVLTYKDKVSVAETSIHGACCKWTLQTA